MSHALTSKGQVTIPKRVREHLGLRPGMAVSFELRADGEVVVQRVSGRKAAPAASPFAKLRGKLKQGLSTDEIMALTRGG
ncbi:MAG: type II toxin-antitoxin system PrlF family antitoxin [Ferrovibrio sp.]|nr:type II toxin-antitoxin system PrlF family antitoxin [Ferrovibrio sp.]